MDDYKYVLVCTYADSVPELRVFEDAIADDNLCEVKVLTSAAMLFQDMHDPTWRNDFADFSSLLETDTAETWDGLVQFCRDRSLPCDVYWKGKPLSYWMEGDCVCMNVCIPVTRLHKASSNIESMALEVLRNNGFPNAIMVRKERV